MQDWFSAATAVERETRRLHGEERAEARRKHYMVVLSITSHWSWAIVVDYDIEQHVLAYMNKSHDYATINHTSVAAIFNKQSLQAYWFTQTTPSPLKWCMAVDTPPSIAKKSRGTNCL
jgi:hypothetical protein